MTAVTRGFTASAVIWTTPAPAPSAHFVKANRFMFWELLCQTSMQTELIFRTECHITGNRNVRGNADWPSQSLSHRRTIWLDSLLLCSFWLQTDRWMQSTCWESGKQTDRIGDRNPSLWWKPWYHGSLPQQKCPTVCHTHMASFSVLNDQPSETATHAKEK